LLSEEREGLLRFGGARMVLLDIEAGFWGLRRQLEPLIGRRLTDAVFRQAGANGGASFARAFVGQVSAEGGPQALRDCVAAYQAAGFGRFEIEALEWPIGRVLVRAWDTFESWAMRRHVQVSEDPACAYTSGVLVGFVNVLADRRDVVCVKHSCQAQAAESCLFELLPVADAAANAGDVPIIALAPDPALGRQINLLEILFDHMPMGIVILDRDLRVRRFNPTWAGFVERYSRIPSSEVAPGARLVDLIPGTEAAIEPILHRVLAGKAVRQEAFRLEIEGDVSYWDAVLTPLVEEGDVVGIVHVSTDVTERVQAREALQSAYQTLEQRVEERTRELSTLLEISHNVASTLELEPLLGLILDELKHVIDYNGATIFTIEGAYLIARAYRGPMSQENVSQMRFPIDDPLDRLVLVERKPVIVSDTRGDDPSARAYRESVGDQIETTFGHIRSWMGAPLVVKDQVIGELALDHSEPDHFAPQHAELLLTFANQVAVAIENARLYRQAEQTAIVEERQRLARELHDSVSQALYGIGLGARTARALLDREPIGEDTKAKLAHPLDYVLSLAQAGLAEMRALIFELRPDALEQEGLAAALDRQAAALRARHELEVQTDLCAEPDLPLEVKEALYRIAQESLNNVVKHARASWVAIRLDERESAVVLEVQDDGVGFDPRGEYPGHLGLHTMEERAARVGGALEVSSSLGRGALLRVCIPSPRPTN
jgi:signal transduction histidine kinase